MAFPSNVLRLLAFRSRTILRPATVAHQISAFNSEPPRLLLKGRQRITDEDIEAWNEFKTKFNKTYDNQGEEQRRMELFLEEKRCIESHNAKPGITFTMGTNEFSDWTEEEYKRLLGYRPSSERA